MKVWSDTTWFCGWLEDHEGMSHCVILACIPLVEAELAIQRQSEFAWHDLHPTIQEFMAVHDLGQLTEIGDDMELMLPQMVGDNLMEYDPARHVQSTRRADQTDRPGHRATHSACQPL